MNISQSVATNQNNSKATGKKKAPFKHSKAKTQVEFVAIPKKDLSWAKKQKPSVMILWMECWECDPYGSRWMTLNHSLSDSAFRKAKKLISNQGLFLFKSDRSINDGRESVSWLVQNLHGARRKNFGMTDDLSEPKNTPDKSKNTPDKSVNDLYKPTREAESTANKELQNPSITSHKHLTNTSVVVKVFDDEEKKENKSVGLGDRDQKLALGEQLSSASPPDEKKEAESKSSLPTAGESEFETINADIGEDSQALNKKSTEILNQDYKFDWRNNNSAERAVAQNLAIDEQKATKEYQNTSKDAFARMRAKLDEQKAQRLKDRIKRLEGDKPNWLQ